MIRIFANHLFTYKTVNKKIKRTKLLFISSAIVRKTQSVSMKPVKLVGVATSYWYKPLVIKLRLIRNAKIDVIYYKTIDVYVHIDYTLSESC